MAKRNLIIAIIVCVITSILASLEYDVKLTWCFVSSCVVVLFVYAFSWMSDDIN